MREQPSFRFTLDQVAYVRPFLERYPAEEADFRRFLAEGRLQLVGALDVMPDDNMPGGETFVRQMQYGKGYYRDKLGVDVTAGWLIDTLRPPRPDAAIARPGGLQVVLVRARRASAGLPLGVFLGRDRRHAGSPRIYLPHSYGLMYGSPNDTAGFTAFANERFDALDRRTAHGPDRVGLVGRRRLRARGTPGARVEEFNRDPKAPFTMRMAVPADFEAAISRRTDRPVFKGELNPIFQGIYSSRIELKAWMRLIERQLLTAEKLSALAGLAGVARRSRRRSGPAGSRCSSTRRTTWPRAS